MVMTVEELLKREGRYCWRQGFPNRKLDAAACAAEMKEILQEHGKLTAELLREKARHKDSALHDGITWNLREAADICQLSQAGDMIGALKIVTVERGVASDPQPVFIHVRDEDGKSCHKPPEAVVADAELYRFAVGELKGIIAAAGRKLTYLRQLAERMKDDTRVFQIDAIRRPVELAQEAMAEAGC
jgi:hypothetical protein